MHRASVPFVILQTVELTDEETEAQRGNWAAWAPWRDRTRLSGVHTVHRAFASFSGPAYELELFRKSQER